MSIRPPPKPAYLPHALYRATQVRELDRCAIQDHGIPGQLLMERAGAAAWRLACEQWPKLHDVTVLCGIGNNGGDGYVLARLALEDGSSVRVLQLGDPERICGDALTMRQRYQAVGGIILPFQRLPEHTDLLVDALFGTGLERAISGDWAAAIEAMNWHPAPILAIDIPSGLHADSGRILGVAAQAQLTMTFIGLKPGLFTGHGPDCCGVVHFAGLDVPSSVYGGEIPAAWRIDWQSQAKSLRPRPRSAHKGHFGHALLIGGAPGMSGALRLAGEAAARCGAGLVTLATHPGHAALLSLARPEMMCHGVADIAELDPLLARATVIAIGPGLGQSAWARGLLARILTAPQPLVVDADALNLLSETPVHRNTWVLTPHPGEAARLLGGSTAQIGQDRFAAVCALQAHYDGVVVLKGAGTLISGNAEQPPALCSDGNPGMASGGMGDLLTGLIAGFIAQGWTLGDAARLGVCLHAAAADRAALEGGEHGLLASDLFPHLRRLLNPVTKYVHP
jgi:ADP-dependent NAD(P)H-hydrate dehydratase / NAD(P)H-hydrate epimerase